MIRNIMHFPEIDKILTKEYGSDAQELHLAHFQADKEDLAELAANPYDTLGKVGVQISGDELVQIVLSTSIPSTSFNVVATKHFLIEEEDKARRRKPVIILI